MKEKFFLYKIVMLVICGVLMLLSAVPPSLQIIPELKLYGVQKIVEKPSMRLSDFYNRSYQTQYEHWLEQHLPLRSYYIRFYSQFKYSLFNKSSLDYVVIGKDNYLFEINFITSYLKLPPSLPLDRKKIEEKVKILKDIQDYFTKRGKLFVLIITPNKAALYPEYIPEKFSRENEHLPGDYDNFIYYCTQYNIHAIDMYRLLYNYKQKHHYELFPKGGIHWNSLAITLACQELLSQIQHIYGVDIPQIKIEKIIYSQSPYSDDYDIIKLMGLFKNFYEYNHPVPIITINKKYSRKYNVSMQGGSFLWGICDFLTSNKVFETINNYFYIIWKQVWPAREQQLFKNKNEIDYHTVLNSDIFIIEANQEYIYNMGSGFVEELHRVIKNNNDR